MPSGANPSSQTHTHRQGRFGCPLFWRHSADWLALPSTDVTALMRTVAKIWSSTARSYTTKIGHNLPSFRLIVRYRPNRPYRLPVFTTAQPTSRMPLSMTQTIHRAKALLGGCDFIDKTRVLTTTRCSVPVSLVSGTNFGYQLCKCLGSCRGRKAVYVFTFMTPTVLR